MSKIRFIRKGGRIIPIKAKKAAIGLGATIGAGLGAVKIRQKGSEVIRGKGKKGTGSHALNFAVDAGLGLGILKLLRRNKKVEAGVKTLSTIIRGK